MKAYGAEICIDCRNFKYMCKLRGLEIDYTDFTESTDNLKEYLHYRENHPAFVEVRARGALGIPFFVDGDKLTTDVNEALSWIGQPPVREEEILERREGGCAACN